MSRHPWMPVRKPRLMRAGIFVLCWLLGTAFTLLAQTSRARVKTSSKIHRSHRIRSASTASAKARPANRIYVVRQGDSLFSIARSHSMTVRALMAANGLKSNKLRLGQELRLSGTARRAQDRPAGPAALTELAKSIKQQDRPNPFSLAELSTEVTASEILSRQKSAFGQDDNPLAESVETEPDAPSPLRFQLVNEGLNFLGVRYRWRGISEKTGFDCSGLVTRLFDQFGISLPHSAREQFKLGTQISVKELQVGDLVFFGGRSKIPTHVAIYIGENCILHAISGAKRVVVSHLEHDWYKKCYLGARRIPELWINQASIVETKADADGSN